ncbi:hypothetical protein HDG41_006515 [Paraburkholderia sp. JPY162]|uniref:Uncharacterized protein n=1 Tax=Paraburkholderia youngii TaxID=2782701 RepID=A0A7W8LCD0_9BURK|nr:hypothetical protein [Paraburkholderia youngii]
MEPRTQQSGAVAPADVTTDLGVHAPLTAEARAIWDRSREMYNGAFARQPSRLALKGSHCSGNRHLARHRPRLHQSSIRAPTGAQTDVLLLRAPEPRSSV